MNKEQERRIMFIDASGLYDKAPVYFDLTWDVLIQKKNAMVMRVLWWKQWHRQCQR
jgi:hypothetical protein